MSYGEELSGEALVKFISDICQSFTQYGGIRPFGVSFLVGDVGEDGPQLYMTEPAGIYFQYNAKAIGSNSMEANKLLEKGWKPNLSIAEGADLAKNVFKKVLVKDFQENRIQFMVTTSEGIKTMSPKK
jgi:20S proteasome alpha/beta subunit